MGQDSKGIRIAEDYAAIAARLRDGRMVALAHPP